MAESGENATILHKDRDFFCGLRAFWQRALVNMNICYTPIPAEAEFDGLTAGLGTIQLWL